ncbi:MAG: ribonuclease E/G [Clostridia bacterium]|nr:ribonuclease E/G [Clostridia bacterium]
MGAPYQILIREEETLRRVALLEGNTLLEYYQENAETDGVVGTVFLGRVERVLPDVKAAFVKIGLKQNGFLPLKEAESYHQTCGNASLMSGQEILVQAKKAPKGGKGAFLTRDIALPGQYVLLMPCNRFIGLSKRVEDTADRERAKTLGKNIAKDRFGLIVRHAALFASEQEVAEEAETLWTHWLEISGAASCRKAPAVMHTETGMEEVLLRDYSARHDVQTLRELEAWQRFKVADQLKTALNRRVALPDGGSLIIDEREALQTIDVNSGSAVKAEGELSLAAVANLRAVPEIARQIRLRNLSGIILIDFIDMNSEKERQLVLSAMEEAVCDDRVKNVIHGFTRLGMMEMTRKRTGDSLRDLLTDSCSRCCETGRVWRG